MNTAMLENPITQDNIKKLKEIIAVYKNDITMLKVDKQAKDWKIGFYDMRLKLQDDLIAELRGSVKELKKNTRKKRSWSSRKR